MMQMTAEHVSLWRIKKEYIRDAKGDKQVQAFWKEMAKDKERHIAELKVRIAEKLQ